MDGHADAPASLTDLASFLTDTPEGESNEKEDEDDTADESTAESDTESEADDQEEEPDDESGEEAEDTPPPDRKIKVPVKGDDGTVSTLEVDETELIKGYERQADYTRKTQALAQRETEAVKFLTSKHEEVRQQYLSQAELARAAVVQMAGIRTQAEMAELAHSDPAGWVAENQRQQSIAQFLNGLDQQINGEKQTAAQQQQQYQQQAIQAQFQKAWQELEKEKIDKPTLAKIYGDVAKTYGLTQQELDNVYDHRLVKMMRDATAYQALKSQKSEVTKKAQNAPRMPNKQSTPANERQTQKLNDRFKGGRAKLTDLAALLR